MFKLSNNLSNSFRTTNQPVSNKLTIAYCSKINNVTKTSVFHGYKVSCNHGDTFISQTSHCQSFTSSIIPEIFQDLFDFNPFYQTY